MSNDDEIIVGIHAVAEALAAGEPVRKVIIGAHRKADKELAGIFSAAKRNNVEVAFEGERWFARFQHARHQHVAALTAAFRYADWKALRGALRDMPNALVLALDHIEDPHNLGALVRNAECAGAHAVVIPERRGAGITAAARRAASGAASHLPIAMVPNLVRALEDLKQDGHWVHGLAVDPAAIPYTEADFRGKCTLVVGSEGKGLSRLVAERCDRLVKIPVLGRVASLNASSAGAVVLYEVVRQRTSPSNTPLSR
jgi:23S rRNA (guanosine2251-2'-O)-methyltransferase